MSAETVIACRGLERHLGAGEGRVQVLRGVDIAVARGTVAAVVGPSGCGKSTLLYLLGLLDRPGAGSLHLLGRDVTSAGDAERTRLRNRHVGFVFQFHFLLPEFTAEENVELPMRKLGRRNAAQRREAARGLLAAVGLAGKEHRLPSQLSGGEQQRVAVARALANDPDLLLADEPTGNLDAANSRLVFDLLAGLARERRQAVVVVTHNAELAARCDATFRMRDGVMVEP